ncbi:MAG TPA: type II secretion system protein, partial [Thermoanaerobaculia bacterium]|nr:type II secretion system protein [Thermoanaerobaculia bacterium]
MEQRDRSAQSNEKGFTLAGVLVILTVLSVILAYSVPRMWSDVMKRERDYQLLFVMEQYARAIQDFQRARGALPVSLEQLEKQQKPRVLRQLYPNPLSGEVDWILVPVGTQTGQTPPGTPPGQNREPERDPFAGDREEEEDSRGRGRGRSGRRPGGGPGQGGPA